MPQHFCDWADGAVKESESRLPASRAGMLGTKTKAWLPAPNGEEDMNLRLRKAGAKSEPLSVRAARWRVRRYLTNSDKG